MIQKFYRKIFTTIYKTERQTLIHRTNQKIPLLDSLRQKHKIKLHKQYWPRAGFLEDLLFSLFLLKKHQILCRQHHFLQGCSVVCTAYSNSHHHVRGNREPEVPAKQINQNSRNASMRADIFPSLMCPLLTTIIFPFAAPKSAYKLTLFWPESCTPREHVSRKGAFSQR